VVGDQDPEVAIAQASDQRLDLLDGDRVDAGEGLVEQEDRRIARERARDLEPAALASRERVRQVVAEVREVELLHQLVGIGAWSTREIGIASSTASRLWRTFMRRKMLGPAAG
jgi:hypothetical protein